jgi:hypothetical protein
MTALRPGAQVRVTAPDSRFYGATGYVIGRTETGAPDGWLIRFTTLGVSVTMFVEELELIGAPASQNPRAPGQDQRPLA